MKNRPHLKTILALTVLLGSFRCYSQFHYQPPVRVNTPYGTRTIQGASMSYRPMNFYNSGPYSKRYKYTIILSNDSSFTTRTKIALQEPRNKVKVKIGSEKKELFPGDTKSISRTSPTGKVFIGIPADTCWLFKTVQGKINCYSFLAEPGMTYVIAIQKGKDGEIVKLDKDNVLSMVAGHEKAMALAEKKELIEAIQEFNTPE
jgi:hypothetical protein